MPVLLPMLLFVPLRLMLSLMPTLGLILRLRLSFAPASPAVAVVTPWHLCPKSFKSFSK